MVIKAYFCDKCKKEFDIEKDMNDIKEEVCKICGAKLRRIYSVSASHITGGYDSGKETW